MEENNLYDNQIECARCGERFSYELIRCPACGVSVYPDGELEGDLPASRYAFIFDIVSTPLHSLLVVLASWIAAVCMSLIVYIPVRLVFTASLSDIFIQLLVTLAVSTGAFTGGYLSARFARIRRLELGIVVGILSLFVTFALLARDFQDIWGALLSPVTIFGWGAIVLAGYGGAWLATGHVREQMAAELFAFVRSEEQLYQDLLVRLGHDPAVAERLIEYEREMNPKAKRVDLIRLAIERWDRDNRGVYKSGLDT